MNHDVGIQQIVEGSPLAPGKWFASCTTCRWEGPEHKHATDAQADAIGHQGGTLRTKDLRPRARPKGPMGEPEMFPEKGFR